MSLTSKARGPVGRRVAGKPTEPTLPTFADWSPSWRAREDFILGEALCQISKTTLSAKALGRNEPERTEALDEILDYFASQGVFCRTTNDVERRVVALESAFGDEPSDFHAFRAIAARVATTEPPLPSKQKKAPPKSSATAPAKPPGRGAAGKSGDKRAAEAPAEAAGSGRAAATAKPNQSQAKKAKLAGRRSGGHSPGAEEESDSVTEKEEEGGAANFATSVSAGAGGGSAALFSHCNIHGCPLPSLHAGICQAAAGGGPRQRQATQRLGVGDGFLNTPASAWGSTLAAATKAGSQTPSSSGASARPANSPAVAAVESSPPPAGKARSGTAAATAAGRPAPKGLAASAAKGKLKADSSSNGSSSSGAGAAAAAGRRGGGRSAAVVETAAEVPKEEAEESRVPSAMEVEEEEMEREMEAAALSATAVVAPAVTQSAAASASTSSAAPVARSARAPAGKDLPAALSLRDNEGFPVAAPVLSALVRHARRNVYTRLLARAGALGGEEDTAGEEIHGHLHLAVRSELRDQLLRTAGGLENATLLLVGPKGAGKSRLLGAVLAGLRGGNGVDEPVDYLTVDLTTLLMSDESSTLMAIAAQLGLTAQIQMKRFGSFADGLRHMLHLLRRSRPGSQGQARREGQAQPVCFVLHDFEAFALRPKQTFLYSLFDLCQTDEAHMVVAGLTSRVDALDLLEKRVRSRFSGRQLLLGYLAKPTDASALVTKALHGAAHSAEGADEAAARGFALAWDGAARELGSCLETSAAVERLLWQGLTPRTLLAGLKLHLVSLTSGTATALPTIAGLEHSLTVELPLPVPEGLLPELSVVELLLLLCLKKRVDKEMPPPHSLRAVLREYAGFLREAPEAAAQYALPNAPLKKAFEHLCALGLVRVGGSGALLSMDGSALRLVVPPRALEVFVRGSDSIPTLVKRFGSSWLN